MEVPGGAGCQAPGLDRARPSRVAVGSLRAGLANWHVHAAVRYALRTYGAELCRVSQKPPALQRTLRSRRRTAPPSVTHSGARSKRQDLCSPEFQLAHASASGGLVGASIDDHITHTSRISIAELTIGLAVATRICTRGAGGRRALRACSVHGCRSALLRSLRLILLQCERLNATQLCLTHHGEEAIALGIAGDDVCLSTIHFARLRSIRGVEAVCL